jgi:hypothetical protein
MPRKIFTPNQANRTLPLVKRIVADINATGAKMRALVGERDGAEQNAQELREHERRLERLTAELERIGCSYKDWNFEVGLVDFPSVLDGRPVLLCWRSDEDSVAWYHEPEAGYAGRKIIPKALL